MRCTRKIRINPSSPKTRVKMNSLWMSVSIELKKEGRNMVVIIYIILLVAAVKELSVLELYIPRKKVFE